jgi:hypothetical protein
MQHAFILNPHASPLDLKDAIHEVCTKSKAILTCMLFAMNFAREEMELDQGTIYHLVSTMHGYVDEMAQLFLALEEITP